MTDEPDGTESSTGPHQLVVDLAPTAHLGWQLALTCQSRPVRAQLTTSITLEGYQMPNLHSRLSDGATEALNLRRTN